MNARRQFSDDDVDKISERVRYYIRKGFQAVYAIERAVTDFKKGDKP